MAQTSSQSTVNKIEMRLRGKGRGSIVFQQDYADCGTPSAVRLYTCSSLILGRRKPLLDDEQIESHAESYT